MVLVDVDCDRDALRFTVRQAGGFCHTGTYGCWPERFSLATLERIISERRTNAADTDSGTARLLADHDLLEAKLLEEADELARARSHPEVVGEAADLFYFALVKATDANVSLTEIERLLALRSLQLSRRPMKAKRRVRRGER